MEGGLPRKTEWAGKWEEKGEQFPSGRPQEVGYFLEKVIAPLPMGTTTLGHTSEMPWLRCKGTTLWGDKKRAIHSKAKGSQKSWLVNKCFSISVSLLQCETPRLKEHNQILSIFFKVSKMTNHWPLQPHTHFSLNCSLNLISRERENKWANARKQPRVPWGYNNWGRNILNYTLGQNDFRLIRNQNYPRVPVDCLCLEFIWRLRFSSSPHYHYYEECVYIDPVILSSRKENTEPLNPKNPPVEGSAPAGEMCSNCSYPLTKHQVSQGPQHGARQLLAGSFVADVASMWHAWESGVVQTKDSVGFSLLRQY